MYRLKLYLDKDCKLSFIPRGKNEIQKIFFNDTYWYPQRIYKKKIISLNISSFENFKINSELAVPEGHMFGAFEINNRDICYIYSGSLKSNRISKFLDIRPFFAKNNKIYYFFSDNDFMHIIQDIKKYVNEIIGNSKDYSSLSEDSLEVLRKIEQSSLLDIVAELNIISRFFEIYCGNKCVKATLSHEKLSEKCSTKIGLNLFLHIVTITPLDTWLRKYHRGLIIYLLQQDFLAEWTDITKLDEERREIILLKAKAIAPSIKNIEDFDKEIRAIMKSMVDRHDIFRIIYFLTRYEGGSPYLKQIFDNWYYMLPKKTEAYLAYPKFQPKLFIDGFELHFIMTSIDVHKIYGMERALGEIFDEVTSVRTGIDLSDHRQKRYRFICKLRRGIYYIDRIDFSNVLEIICKAINTIAKERGLLFNEKEAWLKRLNLKIETPPQFEEAVLEAFSKKWVLQHIVSEDTDEIHLFSSDQMSEGTFESGIIPEEIKRKFEDVGIFISEKYLVRKENDGKWIITDKENEVLVETDGKTANFYEVIKGKIISADVFCDYPSLASREFKFSFLRDAQSNFSVLNKRLEGEFRFKMMGRE